MSPTPQDLGVWIVCLLALVPSANIVFGWFRKETPKRLVSFDESYATTAALDRVKTEVFAKIGQVDADVRGLKESIISNGDARRVAIEGKVEAAREEASLEAGRLHEKINDISNQVSALAATTELLNQNLLRLADKLDRKG